MKLTVITITWNAELHLERTIKSVLALRVPDIEYIIIDGGSTDGTMAIVERYRKHFATVLSERDRGISDAWNKGLALATGEVIALLNAGDEHDPEAASLALSAIEEGADLTYGCTELVNESGQVVSRNTGHLHLWKYGGGLGFYHPSVFARTSLYREIGGFDLKLKFAMDVDWILRAKKYGAVIRRVDSLTRMLDDGVSVKNRFLAYGEYLQCLSNHMGSNKAVYLSMISTGVRGLARTLLGR